MALVHPYVGIIGLFSTFTRDDEVVNENHIQNDFCKDEWADTAQVTFMIQIGEMTTISSFGGFGFECSMTSAIEPVSMYAISAVAICPMPRVTFSRRRIDAALMYVKLMT